MKDDGNRQYFERKKYRKTVKGKSDKKIRHYDKMISAGEYHVFCVQIDKIEGYRLRHKRIVKSSEY